ncbi:unnamed protein product [Prunus armeniaca]
MHIRRADIVFDGVVGGSSHGRTITDGGDHVDLPFGNTIFGIMATELMKMAEDTCVWHRFVGRSPGGRHRGVGHDHLSWEGCFRWAGSYPSFWGAGHLEYLVSRQNVEVVLGWVPEVGLAEATLESIKGSTIVCLGATRVFVAEADCILPKGLILALPKHVQVLCGPVKPIQGRSAEGGREDEAHAFVTKALASEGRLEGVDMGERILRASVEGDTEWLNVLLVVIEDTFGKGPKSWLRPEGLVAAVLLTLQMPNFLEKKPHGWGLSKVPNLLTPRCDPCAFSSDPRDGLCNLCRPSSVHGASHSARRCEEATTCILGEVTLGALGLSHLAVTLQRAVVKLQLNIFGMEMFVFIGHLGDAGVEELYLCLDIGIC